MALLESLLAGLSPELVWGLFPRIIAALQLFAMACMVPQVLPLSGARGLAPLRLRLQHAARDFPGLAGYRMSPTLAWINTSDAFLVAIPLMGCAGAALAIYGGPYALVGQLVAWACFLSLDAVFNLGFPWDCMLAEASFLALFLPGVPALPELEATVLPPALMSFMWRLFAVRLMWGFALTKFIGTRKKDTLYLKWFMTWMPLSTPLSYWMYHAPRFFLVSSYALMFVLETVFPGLALFSGPLRMIGAVGLIFLMVGIELTGNWGYFNVGYAALCFCLFDTQSSITQVFSEPLANLWATPELAALNGVVLFMLFLQLVSFPFNNWVTLLWANWAWHDVTYKLPFLKPLFALCRWVAPFRIVHGYGVFPPISMAPVRIVPVFEGSNDGQTWKRYAWHFLPTSVDDGPKFIAPYHPRLEQALTYVAGGMNDSTLVSGLSGFGKPFTYAPRMMLECLMQRVLEGEKQVMGLFRDNPFPKEPPRYVRVQTYAFHPTTPDEKRATGRYYRMRVVGTHLPPASRDASVFDHMLASPECFHPDMVHHRYNSRSLTDMLAAYRQGQPLDDVLRVRSDLTAEDVRMFWQELVPALERVGRGDWSRLQEAARAMDEPFGEERIRRFERILERAVLILRQSIEAHAWGKAQPHVQVRSNFHLHVLMQVLVLDGRETFEASLRDAGVAAKRAAELTKDEELWAIGLFRHRVIAVQIRCTQLTDSITDWPTYDVGAMSYWSVIRAQYPRYPIWTPECTRLPNGDWSVRGFEAGTDHTRGAAEPASAELQASPG